MAKFLLIRHATTDSVGKRLSGRTADVHLNEEGVKQAKELAQRFINLKIDALYSSPLERARETAAPIAELKQLECNVHQHLNEIDFGEWTNLSFDDLKDNAEFGRFNNFRSCTRIPGGELMAEAQLRFINGIEMLSANHTHQTIAIVSHADLIRSCIAYYAGIHLDMFQRIEISPASVSIIELCNDTAKILLLNHTGKIEFNY